MTARRILMTGASGFVGRHLRAALAEREPDSQLFCFGLRAGRERDHCRALDLLDHAAVGAEVERTRPDVVIHLAGQASVGLAHGHAAEATWTVNVSGTLNLALAVARHAPAATLLFASSGEVYGRNLTDRPATEETPTAPINAYAKSKVVAERLLADVLPATAQLIAARPFNHTGPGQREDFVLPSFAGQIARMEAGLQSPFLRVGNLDVARDFLDVRDVVSAYLALLAAAPRLPPRLIVNIASGEPRSLRSMLDTLRDLSRVPFTIEVDPARLRPSDTPIAYGDASRLRDVTGWVPRITTDMLLANLLLNARGHTKTAAT